MRGWSGSLESGDTKWAPHWVLDVVVDGHLDRLAGLVGAVEQHGERARLTLELEFHLTRLRRRRDQERLVNDHFLGVERQPAQRLESGDLVDRPPLELLLLQVDAHFESNMFLVDVATADGPRLDGEGTAPVLGDCDADDG